MKRAATIRNAEQPAGPPGAVQAARRIKSANSQYRNNYNPFRSLDFSRAVSWLEAAQRGIFPDFQWTCRLIEKRDADLLALIERRDSALQEMDWNVNIVAEKRYGLSFDQKLAEAQQAFLTERYNAFKNLYEAIAHLELAAFRGYSHVQVQGDRFEMLDQWNFCRDGLYGPWYWNPEAKQADAISLGAANLLDLARDQILCRVVPRLINEIALLKWIRQNLSDKDWDAFIEIFGLPGCIITLPANIPLEKYDEYRDAAEDVAQGVSGALPNGSTVDFADGPRGSNPFKQRLDHLSEKLVLAGTGGMLTMLTAPGSGTLAGGAHAETFAMIARSEARKISEVFQAQFDQPALAAQFPDKPVLAYFTLAANEERDVGDILEHAVKAKNAGLNIDPEQLSEKTGYRLSPAPAPAPAPAGFALTNRLSSIPRVANAPADPPPRSAPPPTEDYLAAARDRVARAIGDDLAPLRARIEYILGIEDAAFRTAALKNFQRDLPAMLKEMNAEPQAAKALEDVIGTALLNGLTEGRAA